MTELAARLASLLREVAQDLASDVGERPTLRSERIGTVGVVPHDLKSRDIEELMPILSQAARDIIDARKSREQFLPVELFGEPAWNILLDLFVNKANGRRISVTSACIASGVPTSTALRYIDFLIMRGLVDRVPSEADRRVSFVEISAIGTKSIAEYLVARCR